MAVPVGAGLPDSGSGGTRLTVSRQTAARSSLLGRRWRHWPGATYAPSVGTRQRPGRGHIAAGAAGLACTTRSASRCCLSHPGSAALARFAPLSTRAQNSE